ncbi:DNA/RNA helicase domain-containing protein [Rhodococcus erythropolis]|uniref:DNA/RNA helicase domain-containing protein n=1 Tax=Rhodococcus erythropolis TaxID=1833 RepID=UPI0022B2ADEF|nr:DNA/RNA helicase domain-containing protein [Rhodococcus erythropolis]MCZ4569772.1 DUF2075 domain-containing protein [Rhodococcus erythropolis]
MGFERQQGHPEEQLRCGGSVEYVQRVKRLLHLGHEKPYQWIGDPRFTIRIADTAQELEKILSLQ